MHWACAGGQRLSLCVLSSSPCYDDVLLDNFKFVDLQSYNLKYIYILILFFCCSFLTIPVWLNNVMIYMFT